MPAARLAPLRALLLCGAAAALLLPAAARGAGDGVQVSRAWVRTTPPGATQSAGYAVIYNRGADDRLIGASTPIAATVEIHESFRDGAMVRMRRVEGGVVVPGGAVVNLRPGGLHLMLIGLERPMAEGDPIPITFLFEHSGPVEVAAYGSLEGSPEPMPDRYGSRPTDEG